MTAIGFEGRKHKRRQYAAGACIASTDGSMKLPCAIVDISSGGACLQLDRTDRVPGEFLLVLSANGSVRRLCRIAWRSQTQIGVRFV